MNASDLLAIAHRGMAIAPPPTLRHQKTARQIICDGVVYRRQDYPDPGFNFASVLGPSPPLARIVAVAEEFFAGLPPGAYGILVEADAGHPVEAELRAAGWRIAEDEPALVLPHLPEPAPLPAGLEIHRITESDELLRQVEAVAAAFDTPMEVVEKMMPRPSLLHDPDIAVFAGYCDGKPVCGAMCIRIDEIATVHGVATLPAYRHRGFGQAITWAAVHEGRKLGCTTAALRASGASFEMYKRMGFVPVCKHRTYAPAKPG
jgi:ribosomal protein S18 acetylase RimI-like enzyme